MTPEKRKIAQPAGGLSDLLAPIIILVEQPFLQADGPITESSNMPGAHVDVDGLGPREGKLLLELAPNRGSLC